LDQRFHTLLRQRCPGGHQGVSHPSRRHNSDCVLRRKRNTPNGDTVSLAGRRIQRESHRRNARDTREHSNPQRTTRRQNFSEWLAAQRSKIADCPGLHLSVSHESTPQLIIKFLLHGSRIRENLTQNTFNQLLIESEVRIPGVGKSLRDPSKQ